MSDLRSPVVSPRPFEATRPLTRRPAPEGLDRSRRVRVWCVLKHLTGEAKLSPGQIARGGIVEKLWAHVFEIATSIVWLLSGVTYLYDPATADRSPVGAILHPYDYFWSGCYVIGGPLVLYGLFRSSQRVRVAGLVLLATGLTMHFVAALSQPPFEIRDFVYLTFALACIIRAVLAADTVTPVVSKRARS